MKEDIIDRETLEVKSPLLYKFQIIEFVLIVICFSMYLIIISFDSSGINPFVAGGVFSIVILNQAARIPFEYKEQLITQFGIVLKVFLLLFTIMIFRAMWMKITAQRAPNLAATFVLLSVAFPYLIYALALDRVSTKTKLVLTMNVLCIAVLAVGIWMNIVNHPLKDSGIIPGLVLTLLSLFSFMLLKTDINRKGKYHAVNYFGRSLLFVILGLVYMF